MASVSRCSRAGGGGGVRSRSFASTADAFALSSCAEAAAVWRNWMIAANADAAVGSSFFEATFPVFWALPPLPAETGGLVSVFACAGACAGEGTGCCGRGERSPAEGDSVAGAELAAFRLRSTKRAVARLPTWLCNSAALRTDSAGTDLAVGPVKRCPIAAGAAVSAGGGRDTAGRSTTRAVAGSATSFISPPQARSTPLPHHHSSVGSLPVSSALPLGQ